MKNFFRNFLKSRQFHIIIFILIIIAILFVFGMIVLRYNVEGEGNPPFYISKISIISSTEGTDGEDAQNKWNLSVNQNNDIYLYIQKNENYQYTETIESIVLDNFNINKAPQKGELKLLKPDNTKENSIFVNKADNETDKIEYIGDMNSDVKNMKISNQGGLVVFRYAIENLGNYISNDDEQINHDELLKKLSIKNEDLSFEVSFDVTANLTSKKTYKTRVTLDLPVGDVVNKGVQSVEKTDLNDIIFKRN